MAKSKGRPVPPAAAKNTPAPDPQPGDDLTNEPGSAPLEVAQLAPGGVQMVAIPTWAIGAGIAAVAFGFLGIGLALARRN
jgi:hypothetical protein